MIPMKFLNKNYNSYNDIIIINNKKVHFNNIIKGIIINIAHFSRKLKCIYHPIK